MARHTRHISPIDTSAPAGGLKTSIQFTRIDRLWIGDVKDPFDNNYVVQFPLVDTWSVYGPNVLDVVQQDENGKWRFRDFKEMFLPKTKRGKYGFLKPKYATGGSPIQTRDGFYIVEKKSTVSISTLVFKLAIGMLGGVEQARKHIFKLASEAWERDNLRAFQIYQLIDESPGKVLEHLPDNLRAKSTVSLEVESSILHSACLWLGVDPEMIIQRQRGRPKSKKKHHMDQFDENELDMDDSSSSGSVIFMTIDQDEKIIGRLLKDYQGYSKDTKLADLSIHQLASILGSLLEENLNDDADLLEAYLDAFDENWRDIASQGENSASAYDPWVVLGVKPGSSLEEVKKAYKNTMRKIHPDTANISDWFAITVGQAYKQIKQDIENGQ